MALLERMAGQGIRYYCSSSISNWRSKIEKRYGLENGWGTGHTIFFGCYNWEDYMRIILHRGKRTIFWCGSDLRDLNWLKRLVIRRLEARHICETEHGEATILREMAIEPEILPQFFSNPDDFQPCFRPSETPHVFVNVHPGREVEYGMGKVEALARLLPEFTFHIYGILNAPMEFFYPNIIFHGRIPEARFNYEIKFMQAGLRFNHFDGNSEVVMKSILLGQYPLTYLIYPDIPSYNNDRELLEFLRDLKNKKVANPAGELWRKRLNETQNVLLQ